MCETGSCVANHRGRTAVSVNIQFKVYSWYWPWLPNVDDLTCMNAMELTVTVVKMATAAFWSCSNELSQYWWCYCSLDTHIPFTCLHLIFWRQQFSNCCWWTRLWLEKQARDSLSGYNCYNPQVPRPCVRVCTYVGTGRRIAQASADINLHPLT